LYLKPTVSGQNWRVWAAVVREREHPLVEGVVVGHEHAPFTGRDSLGAVEGEGAEGAERAGPPAAPLRADRLGRVLDHRDAAAAADVEQGVHVAEVAVEVDGDDRLRPWADRGLRPLRIDAPGVGEHVDEHRRRAEIGRRRR
jgi:hypothetical protein